MRSAIVHTFAVLTLGIGVGLVSYAFAYNSSRKEYLGKEDNFALSYQNRTELHTNCALIGSGFGLLTMSGATFYLKYKNGRLKRDAVAKSVLPEV